MATIEYKFSDGHIEEIEVTEEFAKQYKEIDKEYFRNEEKFDWRTRNKEMSMERLQKEFGMDMPDDAPAVDEQVINEDFIKRFISVLTEPQKEIFKKAYIENKSLRLISRETNTCLSTVQKHILLIQKKFIKNIFAKGGSKVGIPLLNSVGGRKNPALRGGKMEYLNVLISNTELYVPVNEKLGKAMLLAYKRLNYQKYISRLRRPQQNFAETGRIELNSDFFYALEDVLDEQGNHNILHHHFETFSLEERKMLYELFREDKTIRFLVIVRGYQAEYVLNTIRKFFEELKKKI